MAILIGKINKIIYFADNYTVANIKVSARVNETAVYQGELPLRKSMDTTLFGDWKNHKKYGKHFVVSRLELMGGTILTKKGFRPSNWINLDSNAR